MSKLAFASVLVAALISSQSEAQVVPGGAMPAQSAVVRAQGQYALTQLQIFAAVYGKDPSGLASREALEKGWAPVNRNYASPTHGWPARGPSLGESIEPLLSQARASQISCDEIEGPCQKNAASWAKLNANKIIKAKNPGAELSKVVAGFN